MDNTTRAILGNMTGALIVGALAGSVIGAGVAEASVPGSVPAVAGDSPARAEHILSGDGYSWKTNPASPHGGHWHVASQNPAGGSTHPAGTVVTLKLARHSTGVAEVTVPAVTGDKYRAAVRILAQSGLTARRAGLGNFTVARENPGADSTVARGSTVTLSP